MKKLLLSVMGFMLIFAANVNAQTRSCVAHEIHQNKLTSDAKYAARQAAIEQHTQAYLSAASNRVSGSQIIIPCIVHVVYANSQENISDAQVQSQIDRLNLDFSATNSDYNNTPSEFAGVRSGDTDIRFELIEIQRHSDSRDTWGTNDAVKSSYPPIEPERILNMWVADIGGGILGYAQFPGGNPSTDGVVMSPQYFGDSGASGGGSFYLSAPFDKGRTATHEVGHWLNLRHIWGDGNCNADDFVSDTPYAGGPNYGCPSAGTNSCTSKAGNDMFMNYMDYVDDACMFMFSAGQDARMQATFSNGGGREGFLLDPVYVPGGGTPPPSCSTTSSTSVTLSLTTDNYGSETSWTLTNASGTTVASGSGYGNNQTITETINNLAEEAHTFTINDSYGDGICCSYGNGSYELKDSNDQVLSSGGSFGSSASVTFCAEGGGTPPPTCDVVPTGLASSNVAETTFTLSWGAVSGAVSYDVDVNGTVLNSTGTTLNLTGATGSTTYTCKVRANCSSGSSAYSSSINVTTDAPSGGGGNQVIFTDGFESGWGNWNDGGSDCARYSGSRSSGGSYSIRIRDNSGNASSMTTDAFNASAFNSVQVDFAFYSYSMENNEDFWVQYSGNGGSSWTTIQTYARGTDFNNNTFYTATVNVTSGLTSNAMLRFRCDASGNNDHIYIDDVTVTGISGAKLAKNTLIAGRTMNDETISLEENELDGVMTLYPNPTEAVLNVSLDEMDGTTVEIYTINGKLVKSAQLTAAKRSINVADLKSGLYIVKAVNKEGTYTERFYKN